MPQVMLGRHTADIDGPFVVFLIGLRLNRLWAIHKWWKPMMNTLGILRFLRRTPPEGYLGGELALYSKGVMMVQYWRGFDTLEAFSHDKLAPHLGAWVHLGRQSKTDHTFGFWHETYQVQPDAYECIYGNMPVFGLAKAARHVTVPEKMEAARSRLEAEAAKAASTPQ